MAAQEPEEVESRTFQGQASFTDEKDLQGGQAAQQLNLVLLRNGELQIRAGARRMTWDE